MAFVGNKSVRSGLTCVFGVGLLLAARFAAADDVRDFGSLGVVEVSAGTSLNAAYSSIRPAMGASYSSKDLGALAGLAYFVSDGLSIGGFISLDYSSDSSHDTFVGYDRTSIAIGPTVGYNAWVRPQLLSVWPQATISYGHETYSYDGAISSVTYSGFGLTAMVPLVIHPARHFFFEVGPSVYTDLTSKQSSSGQTEDSTKTTSIRLFAAIGGWF